MLFLWVAPFSANYSISHGNFLTFLGLQRDGVYLLKPFRTFVGGLHSYPDRLGSDLFVRIDVSFTYIRTPLGPKVLVDGALAATHSLYAFHGIITLNTLIGRRLRLFSLPLPNGVPHGKASILLSCVTTQLSWMLSTTDLFRATLLIRYNFSSLLLLSMTLTYLPAGCPRRIIGSLTPSPDSTLKGWLTFSLTGCLISPVANLELRCSNYAKGCRLTLEQTCFKYPIYIYHCLDQI